MPEIVTLGDAYQAGWGIRVRCRRGDYTGPAKIERCSYTASLSMETLVCTRGRAFPLARLPARLRCPSCGDTNVQVAFDVPGGALPVFVPDSPYRRRA